MRERIIIQKIIHELTISRMELSMCDNAIPVMYVLFK